MKIKIKYILDMEDGNLYLKATDVIDYIKYIKLVFKDNEQVKVSSLLNYLENKFYEIMLDSLRKIE